MCGGVEYKAHNPKSGQIEHRRTYFPIPYAKLPVVGAKGAALVTWGKRKGEYPDLDIPLGGWARLDSLEAGRWDRFEPQPVVIPVRQFMEKDRQGTSHWFLLEAAQVLRGIGLRAGGTGFVYVVTVPGDDAYERMPHPLHLNRAREWGDFAWPEKLPWLDKGFND
jgi:hypothetical protein